MTKRNIVGIIYLTLTAMIWGSTFVAQYIGGEYVGPYTFVMARSYIGALFVFVLILIRNKIKYNKFKYKVEEEDEKEETFKLAVKSSFFLFIGIVTQQIGVRYTTTAKAGFEASLTIIMVPIIMLFYKKKIRFLTWIFIFLTIVGIFLITMASYDKFNYGDLLGVISSFFYSLTIIQVDKYINRIDPLKFSMIRILCLGIYDTFFSLLLERNSLTMDNIKMSLFTIMYAGVFSSGVAYTLQILGQDRVNPVVATLIMSFEGMFATLSGFIFLHQTLTPLQIVGCVLMTFSIIMVNVVDVISFKARDN